jgi:hypothetical protein
MHIQLFHEAKTWFEAKLENSVVVVGGILSPSHDSYVRPKLRQQGTFPKPFVWWIFCWKPSKFEFQNGRTQFGSLLIFVKVSLIFLAYIGGR